MMVNLLEEPLKILWSQPGVFFFTEGPVDLFKLIFSIQALRCKQKHDRIITLLAALKRMGYFSYLRLFPCLMPWSAWKHVNVNTSVSHPQLPFTLLLRRACVAPGLWSDFQQFIGVTKHLQCQPQHLPKLLTSAHWFTYLDFKNTPAETLMFGRTYLEMFRLRQLCSFIP